MNHERIRSSLLGLTVMAGLLTACGADGPRPVPTVQEVLEHPDVYAGESVIVSGRVGEVLNLNAFTLIPALQGGQQENREDARLILVLRADPSEVTRRLGLQERTAVFEGNEVVVAGPLGVFDAAELGERLGASLAEFAVFEGEAVIVAVVVQHARRPPRQ